MFIVGVHVRCSDVITSAGTTLTLTLKKNLLSHADPSFHHVYTTRNLLLLSFTFSNLEELFLFACFCCYAVAPEPEINVFDLNIVL